MILYNISPWGFNTKSCSASKKTFRKSIFEVLTYNEGTYGRSISRFWNNRYLPLFGIKTDKNGFHCFRHSVIEHLKQKGVEPYYINELVGPSQGNISLDRYGKGYNPDILYNMCVKRIMYETSRKKSIDFLALKVDWKKFLGEELPNIKIDMEIE